MSGVAHDHVPLKGVPGKQVIDVGAEEMLRIHVAPGFPMFIEGLWGRRKQLVRVDAGAQGEDLVEALREANDVAQREAPRA